MFGRDAAGIGVRGHDSGKVGGFKVSEGAESVLNYPRNRKKGNPFLKERCDG